MEEEMKDNDHLLGMMDREQLLEAFKCVGVQNVDEALIDQIICQLDSTKTGHVTSEQLISIIKSLQDSESCPILEQASTSWTTSGPSQCVGYGPSSLHSSNSPISFLDTELFSYLDTESVGLATISTLLSYWESIGVTCGVQVLADLGLAGKQGGIDLKELSDLLNDELNQSKAIISYPTINAGIATLQHEVRYVKASQENITRERDKIRGDLQAANECSSALAVEIDEQNSRQEKIIRSQIQMLEQDWMDNFKNIQQINEKELEKKKSIISQLQRSLLEEKESAVYIDRKLKTDIQTLETENQKLEQEYDGLKKKTNVMEECNQNLNLELQTLNQTKSERCKPSQASYDVEELIRMNKELKDRNDELEFYFQAQSERGRTRKRGRRNSSSSNSTQRRHPHVKSKVMFSAATPNPMKRKGSPVKTTDGTSAPLESPRGEKLMKSSHLLSDNISKEARQHVQHESLQHELSTASLYSPDESPDRSQYSSSESLYQEFSKTGPDTEHWDGLVRTIMIMRDRIKEFENEREATQKSGNEEKEASSMMKSKPEYSGQTVKKTSAVKPIMRSSLEMHADIDRSEHKNFNQQVPPVIIFEEGECDIQVPMLAVGKSSGLSYTREYDTTSVDRKDNNSVCKAFQLCKRRLEEELDEVKHETADILSEISDYSNENTTLQLRNEVLQDKLEKTNVLVKRKIESICDNVASPTHSSIALPVREVDTFCSLNEQKQVDLFVGAQSDEISQLRLKIYHLERCLLQAEERYETDKTDLANKNDQLEESLELMKDEFESMEDYWQNKIEDERTFYDEHFRTNEDQFKELEQRIKEYEQLFEPVDDDVKEDVEQLYTIEETCSMEVQVSEWEEEINKLKTTIDQLKIEHEHEVRVLDTEKTCLKKKYNQLESNLMNKENRLKTCQTTLKERQSIKDKIKRQRVGFDFSEAGQRAVCHCSKAGQRAVCHFSKAGQRAVCQCCEAGQRAVCHCSEAGQGPCSLPLELLNQTKIGVSREGTMCDNLPGRGKIWTEQDCVSDKSSRSLDTFLQNRKTAREWSQQSNYM